MKKTMNLVCLIFFSIFLVSNIHPTIIQQGTKEIGGGVSGTTQRKYNITSFNLVLAPSFSYYFSEHWFASTAINLGYFYETTRYLSTDYTSSTMQLYPKIGIGYYTSITENIVFALPVYIYYEFNFGYNGNLSDRDASGRNRLGYSIQPTIKIGISKSVILSPFISIDTLSIYQDSTPTSFTTYYGLNWTYVW